MCPLYSELQVSHLLTAAFPIDYPQPILPFDALHSKQLATSFHKRYLHMSQFLHRAAVCSFVAPKHAACPTPLSVRGYDDTDARSC